MARGSPSGATELDADPVIIYYTLVGGASLLYVNAAEARRLVEGTSSDDVITDALIEAHADTLVAMLLGPRPVRSAARAERKAVDRWGFDSPTSTAAPRLSTATTTSTSATVATDCCQRPDERTRSRRRTSTHSSTLRESATHRSVADVVLGPPVPRPQKSFGIGLNYLDHAAEGSMEVPANPLVFTKFPSCLDGPHADVEMRSDYCDYEGELVVVIGHGGKDIPAERAWEHVIGVMVGQDISDRKAQFAAKPPHFDLGQVVRHVRADRADARLASTRSAIPRELRIVTSVNGETRQNDTVANMIFDVPTLIAYLSQITTLVSGDLIFTGTPAGIGAVHGKFLADGDVITTTIDGDRHPRQSLRPRQRSSPRPATAIGELRHDHQRQRHRVRPLRGARPRRRWSRSSTDFGLRRSGRDDQTLYMRGTDDEGFVHVTHLGDTPRFVGLAFVAENARPTSKSSPLATASRPSRELAGPGGGEVVQHRRSRRLPGRGRRRARIRRTTPDAGAHRHATTPAPRSGRVHRFVSTPGPPTSKRLGHCVHRRDRLPRQRSLVQGALRARHLRRDRTRREHRTRRVHAVRSR